MFVIKTRVGPSAIHGTGVFAREAVAIGETVWRFDPPFDQLVTDDQAKTLSPAALEHMEVYAYRSADLGGQLVLSGDHAKFLNHDDDPNTEEVPFASIARRSIALGDEITCDYGAFCTDWAGTESFGTRAGNSSSRLGRAPTSPHEHLYTRLQPSSQGVGVFAIRDIPTGTALFVGDEGATVRVPVRQVAQIQHPEIRRMYFDFCPVIDGFFVAPADLNQLTMGWYLNHSDQPNVKATDGINFAATTHIATGYELLTDYTTYSSHAAAIIKNGWD